MNFQLLNPDHMSVYACMEIKYKSFVQKIFTASLRSVWIYIFLKQKRLAPLMRLYAGILPKTAIFQKGNSDPTPSGSRLCDRTR